MKREVIFVQTEDGKAFPITKLQYDVMGIMKIATFTIKQFGKKIICVYKVYYK